MVEAVLDNAGLGPDSAVGLRAIREAKARLDSYRRWIHSLVLFGSYASGQARKDSDADFLVILKRGEQAQKLRAMLFDFALNPNGLSGSTSPIEIQMVVLDEKQIERMFELSTPLAHAFRHGVIIWEDGWFKTLLSRSYPTWPTREAVIESFSNSIVGMYYRCAVDLKREILRDHGPGGICKRGGGCVGHFSGDILARVISRMLYVTLPERRLLPLSKHELVTMSLGAFGESAKEPVALAMDVLRQDRAIDYSEFQVMMPFARRLFRECIRICGTRNSRVICALRCHAEICRRYKKG